MTLEEFVLQRSYLPKIGVYTMEDHVKAMMMSVMGTCSRFVLKVKSIPIVIKVDKATIKVKQDIIPIKISVKDTKVLVDTDRLDVKVRIC